MDDHTQWPPVYRIRVVVSRRNLHVIADTDTNSNNCLSLVVCLPVGLSAVFVYAQVCLSVHVCVYIGVRVYVFVSLSVCKTQELCNISVAVEGQLDRNWANTLSGRVLSIELCNAAEFI